MKVFISWSGPVSKRLGESIRDWLPGVLQLVTPYFTPSDIEKGGRWASDIAKELSSAELGILCVTRDNIHSDWLLFEAGALSKSLDKSFVCPILFGINNTDLAGPLKQFQTTEFTRLDFHKLITVINSRLGDQKLPTKTLDVVFDKWWPDLEEKISEILSSITIIDGPVRADREVLDEILLLSRAASRQTGQPFPPKVIESILETFIKLHYNDANTIGGYQESLDIMKDMSSPIKFIAKRYRGTSTSMTTLLDELEELTYEVIDSSANAHIDEDIPF
ncbi:TIR domain-containing protein [Pseudomonas sp. CCI3.2]|uniref:TIR domain-containing protein n=1 Tax=unclassified Pseudomonas TaxID=196821 RepID=UPI002AC98A12|nr:MULTISPECIES: TIR domain-containing protein [unclassified Pseudomonas]MEB0077975.1 TIR domain-containing protein [Pseudomonas sp. MH10out]MEB0093467.1 TIR domain-containing protein [Pseudomonas sp. CCI4.2]MEB0101689.1 TIR domain-containing protein [Pseudomonas sp. CCI3.2]MEB0129437.1 TIR domain-containing protein [Pseudomonas sp. CCI2.4]MEB0159194.1 TIR domain-containing protein [Pseudomonas sp. AH2 (2023)]